MADIISAIKTQMAYYKQYGSGDVKAFKKTVKYAKSKGLILAENTKIKQPPQ
ncbi:MAG: hypothetical protein ACOCQW_02720 [Halanaerobiaceae bacterium]